MRIQMLLAIMASHAALLVAGVAKRGLFGGCRRDSDCWGNAPVCDSRVKGGSFTCIPRKAIGEACTFDFTCASNSCYGVLEGECQCSRECRTSGCNGCPSGYACYHTSIFQANVCLPIDPPPAPPVNPSRPCCVDCQQLDSDDATFACYTDCERTCPPSSSPVKKPCCEECEKLPDDGQVYSCLADNCDSNCVNSRACIHFTQSAADVAGSLACKDAVSQCNIQGPRMFDAAWARTSVVGSAQCYIASKNICIVQADIFAERGSGQCQFYQSGGGDCGKAKFQKYYAEKRDSLCTDIANGVVITLAGFSG